MWHTGDVKGMVTELGRGWSALKEKAKRLNLDENQDKNRMGINAARTASFYESTYAKMLKKAGKRIPKLGELDMMKAMDRAIKIRPEYNESFVHRSPRHGLEA